ncbi:MAG: VC0807 family protein [Caulobacteraceae bacterium]
MNTPNSHPNDARRKVHTGLLIEVGVNFVLPVLIYDRLKPAHGDVGALLASSLPPLAWSVVEFLRRRRLDALSMLALAGVALSLMAFAGGGGVHMLQLREKLVTGLIGLIFLGSAAIGRPLVYQLARAGEARKSAEELAALEALRDKPLFKRTMMTMTLVWGFGLVAEAALSAALVFVMPVRDYLIVAPILGYGTMGGLGLWTLWFRRRRSARCPRLD